MVSFADDDWFRGLICSMIALGCILVGYATYYQVLEPRWPDYSTYGDDEEDEDDQLTAGKANEAYAQEEKPAEKVEEYSETKIETPETTQEEDL